MPGISFLFWNVARRPLEERVARIAAAHAVDVVILAECKTAAVVTRSLNAEHPGTFRSVAGSGERLRLFTRLPGGVIQALLRAPLDAWLGFRVVVPAGPELILFAAHLPSKLYTDETDRLEDARKLATDVWRMEVQEGHTRAVLVGDLNANPFEAPVAAATGLHGVMTRSVARETVRQIRGQDYSMFYNPMWRVFGDHKPDPPGTYYRRSSNVVNYFWNVYDQVLLRPAVMDWLTDLRVLASDGIDSLLTPGGRPDATNGSDHLPLLFRLDW